MFSKKGEKLNKYFSNVLMVSCQVRIYIFDGVECFKLITSVYFVRDTHMIAVCYLVGEKNSFNKREHCLECFLLKEICGVLGEKKLFWAFCFEF